MNDEGYTLVEALAALTILGMALGGLGLVASLIGKQQLAANRANKAMMNAHAVDQGLERLLAGEGPFITDGTQHFAGSATKLEFQCGDNICGASLSATASDSVMQVRGRRQTTAQLAIRNGPARFAYVDALGETDAWPREGGGLLRAVIVRGKRSAPEALARLRVQEPRDCQFDGVIGACRTVTP